MYFQICSSTKWFLTLGTTTCIFSTLGFHYFSTVTLVWQLNLSLVMCKLLNPLKWIDIFCCHIYCHFHFFKVHDNDINMILLIDFSIIINFWTKMPPTPYTVNIMDNRYHCVFGVDTALRCQLGSLDVTQKMIFCSSALIISKPQRIALFSGRRWDQRPG